MELVIAVILVALVFEYINGFHDTANSIATVVSTKVLTPRQAIALAACTNLIGALLGFAVAKTISSGLVDAKVVSTYTVVSALIGGIVWNLLTWWFGLPSSSTHALVGGLCGAALASAHGDWGVLIWAETTGEHWWEHKGLLYKVIIPMITSPVAGFAVGWLVMGSLYALLRRLRPVTVNRFFGRAQIVSAAYMGFSHGTNDAQKTMGIIALTLAAATSAGTFDRLPRWLGFLYHPETGSSVYTAETRLAEMYLAGEGVARNPKAAVTLLDRAAKGKNVEAAALLGQMHLEGKHVKQDDKVAAKFLAAAADKGLPGAMTNYAMIIEAGRGGSQKDQAKADALRAAAATNAPLKKYALASRKLASAPTNTADLIPWLQGLAEGRNADAEVLLGVAAAQGRGLPPDDKVAFEWFSMAAKRGNPEALFNLGLMHLQGRGVPADPKEAARYFKAASDKEAIPVWIKVICALTMAAGTAAGGWKIIKTLGHKMVKLQPVNGFAAETTAASVLYVAAFFGMPVSTTHAITTSIMGVGCAKRFSALRFKVVERILWAWIFTLPVTALIAYAVMRAMQEIGWAK